MNEIHELLDRYEEVFGESIAIPYMLPSDKTDDDFIEEVRKAIETGNPIDESYWFPSDPDILL